jgi:acetyltransferase-like isoleucine patch superfamily enzyme
MLKDRQGKKLTIEETFKKIVIRLKNYLLDLELSFLYFIGSVPSHHIRRFFYRIFGMKIGTGTSIHTYLRFYNPENISMGKDTIIGDHVFLDGRDKLKIGNHVDIATGVMIYNSQHDVDSNDFHATSDSVVIEDYVFIGPRAIILPGVKIGYGAVIAAGAVVTKSIEPFIVVAGVPADPIRERKNKNPSYKLGRARLFQ